MDNGNIAKSFERLVDSTFVKINGCLVKKGVNEATGEDGFIWGELWYKTVDEVKDAMEGVYGLISLRIVNPNGEVKNPGQEFSECYHQGIGGYSKYKNDQK